MVEEVRTVFELEAHTRFLNKILGIVGTDRSSQLIAIIGPY